MKKILISVLFTAAVLLPASVRAAYEQLGYAEDSVHVSGDVLVPAGCVRKDTSSTGIGANGDYVNCAVNASG